MSDERELRRLLVEAGRDMYNSGLVVGTWGNISVRVDAERMLITPTGLAYNKLKPEEMVMVKVADLSYEGGLKPSTETPLHAAIYRKRSEINAVLHNHSTFACAVAAAHLEVPPILDDLVQLVGGSLPVAAYGLPGSDDLVNFAMDAMGDRNAVILANHGALCLGRNLGEAFTVSQVVEKACHAFVGASSLGRVVPLKDSDVAFMYDFFMNKYGQR